MNQPELCIFLVMDTKYSYYLPLFLHFLEISYPEYGAMLAIKGHLPTEVFEQLKYFNNSNYYIQGNSFEGYPNDPDTIKSLRWTSYFPQFDKYKYIFIGDVDIWIVPEMPTLIQHHRTICDFNHTCYSNTDRIDPPETRGNRMTGLHFFKREEYLDIMYPIMQKYDKMLKKGLRIPKFFNKQLNKIDNQHILWEMIKESGLPMPMHSNFSCHGLHLGHSRCEGRWKTLFRTSSLHRNWFRIISSSFLNTRFKRFYQQAPKEIKNEIHILMEEGVNNVYQFDSRSLIQE